MRIDLTIEYNTGIPAKLHGQAPRPCIAGLETKTDPGPGSVQGFVFESGKIGDHRHRIEKPSLLWDLEGGR